AGDLTISLVPVQDAQLIGHIAFSPVTIANASVEWFGLGPVSVGPAHQGRGIGSALIGHGLDRVRALGAAGRVVVGEPAQYSAFERDDRLTYEGAPPEYFMRISLTADEPPIGRVDYAPAFVG